MKRILGAIDVLFTLLASQPAASTESIGCNVRCTRALTP